MDTIVSFGYEDVMIKNVYYTTIGGSVMKLQCLAGDDSIRDILRMVRVEGCVDIYVDHEVNFAQLAFPQSCWVGNNVVEEGGRHEERVDEEESGHEERLGEGTDGEISGGVDEGDLGNITQEYPIGSKGNTGNTVEKGECSKGNRGNCGSGTELGSTDGYVDDWSSTVDEVELLCSSDKDDEELIDVKKCARSIRRPTEGLEVPSGLQTPKGVKYKHVAKKPTPRSTPIKKPTPISTPIKKLATRSAPVSRGKKVASSNPAELSRLRKEKAKLAEKRYKTLPHWRECQKRKDSTPTKQKKGDPLHPSKGIPVENDVSESDNDGRDSHYENSDDAGKLRDSSTESEEENLFFVSSDIARQRRASNVYFNPSWDVPFFEVGMRFQNAAQFKEAVRKYSVRKGCPLLHIRNEPKRQKFICKFGLCCWEIYGSYVNKDDSFQKCVRAKKMVLKEMEGSFKDEYAMIHAFGGYLKEVNPGNSVFIKTEENDVGNEVLKRRPEGGCLPPVLRTPPGRPRRNKRKDKHEPKRVKVGKFTRLSKHGSVMSCRLCGQQGHNKAGCPRKEELVRTSQSNVDKKHQKKKANQKPKVTTGKGKGKKVQEQTEKIAKKRVNDAKGKESLKRETRAKRKIDCVGGVIINEGKNDSRKKTKQSSIKGKKKA
ncbi:hypothetical protein SLEP1_g30285 [Rubroshorea leprosula]|uniref:CCHC-type domain-containing protein n=1 Tax=Rubroshorea leprosula TaxID=152421 RepID=A0AAV5K848_9ROSI|nr:hypothetical protein SLEP1_g30285 [Rubroshorea leprosula]